MSREPQKRPVLPFFKMVVILGVKRVEACVPMETKIQSQVVYGVILNFCGFNDDKPILSHVENI